jgi:hypothetical protein
MATSSKVTSPSWKIAGAAVLITVLVSLIWRLQRDRPEHRPSQIAHGHSPSPGAASQSGTTLVAGRRIALEDLRQGRFGRAFEFYAGLPAGDWLADDCSVLGSSLLERDRVGLGRAALEAARRIDVTHRPSFDALGAFEHKQAATTGKELARRQQAVRRVQPLRALRGGPPLGLMVLALARYATCLQEEEEFLDRLGTLNFSLLPQVDTPHSAIKLTARLLLETGRAREARDLLDPLLKTGAADSATGGPRAPDREAAWLLSRAALALGAHEAADAMLALAGGFGNTAAGAVEPSPFVGSRRCGECHRSIYQAQQRQSRHALTLRFGTDLKEVALPPGPVADQAIAGITHTLKRQSNGAIELESRDESRVFRAIVDYAVGSGRHGMTMLASGDDGIERELRISYFGLDATWGQTKGIEFAPQHAGDLAGVALGQKQVNQCLSCHTTWYRSAGTALAAARPPEGEDRGIGCERCHGPGLNHTTAAETGFAEMAITLTSKTPLRAQLDSCVECHSADGTVPPTDPEFTRFQGTTFLWSRCFTANQDRFACTTCHSPHAALETDTARYDAKCLGCHAGALAGMPPAFTKSVDGLMPKRGNVCPINAAKNCTACHMPKVEDPSRHARFTDHHIRAQGKAARPGDAKSRR